jgi:parallel beta-helix repeat protein
MGAFAMEGRIRSSIVMIVVIASAFYLTLATLPDTARATTFYVGGSGPGNFTTIQNAIDAAFAGDTVFVYEGVYYENPIVTKPLTLIGENRDRTIINSSDTSTVVYVPASGSMVAGFTLTNGTGIFSSGITLNNVRNCIIENNNITDNYMGIHISSSSQNTITNNKFWNNRQGVDSRSSSRNLIASNTFSNEEFGIILYFSDSSTLINNVMNHDGVFLNGDSIEHWNTHIIDATNTVLGMPVHYRKNLTGGVVPTNVGQVILANCTGMIVENHTMSNVGSGIQLGFSPKNVIANNSVDSNVRYGISLWLSNRNDVVNNSIINNNEGLRIHRSNNNTVRDNQATGNRESFSLYSTNQNYIERNSVSMSDDYGIRLRFSFHDIIANNSISSSGMFGIHNSQSSISIINNTITSSKIHGIYLLLASNNTIANNTEEYNRDFGIYLKRSSNNTILGDRFSNNNVGIHLEETQNTTIVNVTTLNNTGGILTELSTSVTVLGSRFSNNVSGLSIRDTTLARIENNNASKNWFGIFLVRSDSSVIVNNSVSLNEIRGISLESSSGVSVYHNNITGNLVQAFDDTSNNQWDNGYPSGGNNWSDYIGFDDCSGPNQDVCPDPDGFGDTPYIIDADSQDRYPFMVPQDPQPLDDQPPLILNITEDGLPALTIIQGTPSMTITATLDDSLTGGSVIGGANVTSPADAWWNATPMNPDDVLDTSTEDFSLTINTSVLSQGLYDFCVYGWDSIPNNNSTGGCVTLTVIPSVIELEPSPIGVYFAGFETWPVGMYIHVYANLSNTGNAASGAFTVTIFDDENWNWSFEPGETIGSLHVNNLEPLESMFRGVMWLPVTPGLHNICMFADSSLNVSEIDESNNIACSEIEIGPGGPLTNLSIGQPNYTSDHTFITSTSPLTLEAVELSGGSVAYTEYRIDGANWQFYLSPFTIPDEGFHMLEYRSANMNGFVEPITGTVIAVDNTPPESAIQIGDPHYFSNVKWIRSTTPLSIESSEIQLDQSIVHEVESIPVYQENITNGEPFEEYLARSNHTVTRAIWASVASVTFNVEGHGACPDIDLGVFLDENDDGQRQVSELVDYSADADQFESVFIENPQAGYYIISIAGFTVISPGGCLATLDIIQTFGGSSSSGLDISRYRIWNSGQWTDWTDYLDPFNTTDEGLTYVEYYSYDNLANTEMTHNLTIYVDDTPPRSEADFVSGTNGIGEVLLTTNDTGCGVEILYYRIGNEDWQSVNHHQVVLQFNSTGTYTVEYYGIDRIGNVEIVKSFDFEITEEESHATVNWKPLIAAVFAVALALVGLWTSKNRRWKGGEDKRAMLIAFFVFSVPFIIAETITGIVSLFTGILSIPPTIGAGTLVDMAVLITGLLVSFSRLSRLRRAESNSDNDDS